MWVARDSFCLNTSVFLPSRIRRIEQDNGSLSNAPCRLSVCLEAFRKRLVRSVRCYATLQDDTASAPLRSLGQVPRCRFAYLGPIQLFGRASPPIVPRLEVGYVMLSLSRHYKPCLELLKDLQEIQPRTREVYEGKLPIMHSKTVLLSRAAFSSCWRTLELFSR